MLDSHLIVKTSPIAFGDNVTIWKNIRITVLSNTLFGIEKDSKKSFCDSATQAVWFRNMPVVK